MRALLVTHGHLGEALLSSAGSIYAVDAPIDCLSNSDRDLEGLVDAVRAWLARDDDDAVLMVDFGGGSCGVAARAAAADRDRTWVLGGANLPMVLTYLTHHAQTPADDLVSRLLDRGHNAIALLDPGGRA